MKGKPNLVLWGGLKTTSTSAEVKLQSLHRRLVSKSDGG